MTGGLLNPTHVLFVIAIALLVLGPKRLPEVARAIGKGVRELRESVDGPAGVARSLFEDETPESVGPPAATAEPPDVTPAAESGVARADGVATPNASAESPAAPRAAQAVATEHGGGQREDPAAPSARAADEASPSGGPSSPSAP